MKFPESWLRQHVKVEASSEDLAARLTAIGLEVEDAQPIGAALEGVVVAEILSCARHPDAERLQVCQVSVGGDRLHVLDFQADGGQARGELLARGLDLHVFAQPAFREFHQATSGCRGQGRADIRRRRTAAAGGHRSRRSCADR